MADQSKKILRISLLLLVPLLTGCAFFNALYNGWAAFDRAVATESEMYRSGSDTADVERATEKDYLRAIEKAEKAITYYPKSKRTHDDAFFLKGRALFQLEGYQEAIMSFKNLQKFYPESKRIPESWLYMGMCYAGAGNYDLASETYTYVMDNFPELNSNHELLILRADLAITTRGKSQAIPFLIEALERITEPEKRVYIIDRLAGIYMNLTMFGSSIEYLEKLPPFNKDFATQYYSAEMKQALSYRELIQYEKAEIVLNGMVHNRHYALHLQESRYELAVLNTYQKRFDDARDILMDLSASEESNEIIAKSWYQLSLIQIDVDGDLTEGEESLRNCIQVTRDDDLRELAQDRLTGLSKIQLYSDSLLNLDDTIPGWDIRFKLGERYWLDTKLPDSALVHYDLILEDSTIPDSIRAKTLYAKGWILQEIKSDTATAKPLFEEIVDSFTIFEVAKGAQAMLDIPVTIMVRRDSAEARFLEAEILRLETDGYTKDVYYSYLITALKYPEIKDIAARSLYTAGVVVNGRDGVIGYSDTTSVDTSAAKIFGRLCREYPESEQCEDVQRMMEHTRVQGFVEAYTEFLDEQGAEVDPDDSTALVIDSVEVIVEEEKLVPLEVPDFSGWF